MMGGRPAEKEGKGLWYGVEGNLDPVTMQSSDSNVRWESPPFWALTATAANERRGHPAQEGGYFLLLPWTREGGQVSLRMWAGGKKG